MPARRKSSSASRKKRYSKKGAGTGYVWSNSVGTRYTPRTWVNPTIGNGKGIARASRSNTSEAAACMAVALNAFSSATTQPRFPDGKATESVGMKYQMINEVEASAGGVMELLFFPGLNLCMHMANVTSKSLGQTASPANAFTSKIQRIKNHVVGEFSIIPRDNNTGTPQMIQFDQGNERMVAKWRIVSYGLLLSLVNNSDENDGWWESCRISMPSEAEEYGFSFSQPTGGVGSVTQPINIFPKMPPLSSSEMLNTPSYCTGKLRNIHNVQFQLNPEFGERDFTDLAKATTFVSGSLTPQQIGFPLDGETPPPGGNAYTGYNFLSSPNRLESNNLDQFLDRSFDGIFIRIHGVDPSNGRSASRLCIQTVMNQEVVYDEKALNAKFHQKMVFHTQHDKIIGSAPSAQANKL